MHPDSMNSSLEKQIKNLSSDNDFKYLTEEFGSKNLELLKQKDAYPCDNVDNFKRFGEKKLPEKLDGHINNEDYLTCNKIWNEFRVITTIIICKSCFVIS